MLKPQQTLDDPHIKAMGFFQPIEFPGAPRPAPVAKVPVWLSETPGAIRRRAPLLGEHTDEILAELGYDAGGRSPPAREGRDLIEIGLGPKGCNPTCQTANVGLSRFAANPTSARQVRSWYSLYLRAPKVAITAPSEALTMWPSSGACAPRSTPQNDGKASRR